MIQRNLNFQKILIPKKVIGSAIGQIFFEEKCRYLVPKLIHGNLLANGFLKYLFQNFIAYIIAHATMHSSTDYRTSILFRLKERDRICEQFNRIFSACKFSLFFHCLQFLKIISFLDNTLSESFSHLSAKNAPGKHLSSSSDGQNRYLLKSANRILRIHRVLHIIIWQIYVVTI